MAQFLEQKVDKKILTEVKKAVAIITGSSLEEDSVKSKKLDWPTIDSLLEQKVDKKNLNSILEDKSSKKDVEMVFR